MAERYENLARAIAGSEQRRAAAHDARKLRLKAVELRAVADTLSNPSSRRDMLELAQAYDRMADVAEPKG
jgi:hypothetical protein